MTTKEKLLTLFEKNKGVYFSRRCLHQRSPSGKSRRRSAGGLCAHRNQCLSSRKRFSRRTQKYSRSCFFRSHGRRQKPPGRRVSQLFYGAVPVFGGQLLYTGIPGTQFPYREGNPCPSSGRNKKSFCPGCRWGMPADRPV